MVTQAPCAGLAPVEQSLVDHVRRGEQLNLAPDNEAVDEAAMRSWGDSRTCRATVIRDILRGRLAADPDPHGLRLQGARITGRLDLENLTTDVNFELTGCLLEEGVLARDARVTFVGLRGCLLGHPTEPPMDAERLICSVLDLSGTTIIGHAELGAVNLTGAHIGGLDCSGATLGNDSGPALAADGLRVDQNMYLSDGFTATGSGEHGAVRLAGGHIGGTLECRGATLGNDSGPALAADGLQVGQGMYLSDGFTATGSGKYGAVRLAGGHIGGTLDFRGATLGNDSGVALAADGLQVGQGMYLSDGFTATGSGKYGAVRLAGGHIGGTLDFRGATLGNDSGVALNADNLRVDQNMFLTVGFTATGSGEKGAIRLAGAHIGGQLQCIGATLGNDSGPALAADGLRVDKEMYLTGGFTATGSGEKGAVSLAGGHIGSQLVCTGATLGNNSGPALAADGLRVDKGMYLSYRFTATGSGENGAVCLAGGHIGGTLECRGATLGNDSGPALAADGLQVYKNMYLTDGFTATGGGTGVAVDLSGTRVGGALLFDLGSLKHATDSDRLLAVDGLTYAGVPKLATARDWLRLLRHNTGSYAAKPYQQLAAGYQALGDDRQAREILMAQRDDQLARADTHCSEKLWGWITKVTLGYGYQPWRALLFLAAVIALSCVLAVVLGSHGALAQTDKTATPGRPCTVVQQVSVGLDLNLPMGTTVARADCDLTKDSTSAAAVWLTAAGWVLRLLAWAFAALFIAGFTSAVRKT